MYFLFKSRLSEVRIENMQPFLKLSRGNQVITVLTYDWMVTFHSREYKSKYNLIMPLSEIDIYYLHSTQKSYRVTKQQFIRHRFHKQSLRISST